MNNYKLQLMNFVTGNYVDLPQTDEEARECLPQNKAVQGLYEVRRRQGDSIETAMIYVLKACVGEIK